MIDTYLPFVLGGLGGSIVRVAVGANGTVMFPKFIRDEQGHIVGTHLGFLGTIIVGIFVAIIIDHSWVVATFSAYSGADVLERLSRKFSKLLDAIIV